MSQAPLHVEPQLSVSPAAAAPKPPERLFTPGQILGAAIFGSVLAGAILFAINERRLGRPRLARLTIVLGVVLVAACLAVSFAVEGDRHLGFMAHALGFGIWEIARRHQGAAVASHLAAGGKKGSIGGVLLATLGAALFVVALAIAGFVLHNPNGDKLDLGNDDSVYYKKGVTRADAQKIADALKDAGYFGKAGVDVQVRREGNVFTLVLVHSWSKPTPEQLRIFQIMSEQLADAVAPLALELAVSADDFEITTRVHRLPREKIDHTTVYPLDGATPAEAHQLVDTLVKAKLITVDKPHRYELRHDGAGYLVSVPLTENAWDDPKAIEAWTQIAGVVSRGFGGKPVRYRLCDDEFAVKRVVP